LIFSKFIILSKLYFCKSSAKRKMVVFLRKTYKGKLSKNLITSGDPSWATASRILQDDKNTHFAYLIIFLLKLL